ncbi:type IV secretion system protein VirB10 [Paraburkholderia silvatlantica]|uniref:Type IV secretion system protein VirB10 n=1 Tax=Paraburkholderia silvatlantica TaxID=321895 RepID=A0ABR6FZ11_9BURK|nr:type IV secretion system protein VirB10 [Paraburkholderia silvatlantica]MBB2932010.1 type IV secretion system protein VirB10 [Paraburkholderia silvatlantica]PVY24685.1 type IV secretion system protein VirB10 [Paraburkholderia silvatlantica]PXW31181.1 type IV secretion system protein VirB10 [Paraburkholderia silvatlantica]
MNDDTERNLIEPDDSPVSRLTPDRNDAASGASADRGMPALGQYRSARPRAWWLTPIVIVLVVGAGAVWTVHGFLARHDAQAKARRDSVADTSAQGHTFRDAPASAAVVASTPVPASAIVVRPVPASGVAVAPVSTVHAAASHSYYDAPLLATGGGQESAAGLPGLPEAGSVAGTASSVAAAVSGGAGAPAAGSGQAGGALAPALTPTATPRVRAAMLGNRSLILAQGAKIDCVGDTAFDSTQAGISTCTVTKNVYSDDGHVLLIERGSQINSEYRSNLSPGQKRVFVLSARIKTPDGVTVEIDSPAADALGRMGMDGYVDNHWGQRIGAAMLLGITQDAIGYLATRGGNSNGSVVFENTQQQGNDMATRVLDSTINIPPTLKQNQGAEFTIVVARDLDFGSVYALQPEATP